MFREKKVQAYQVSMVSGNFAYFLIYWLCNILRGQSERAKIAKRAFYGPAGISRVKSESFLRFFQNTRRWSFGKAGLSRSF